MRVKRITDFEGDWYWVPENKIGMFGHMNDRIAGREYMDDPESFDEFENIFGHFRTGGDEMSVPDVFSGMKVEFI